MSVSPKINNSPTEYVLNFMLILLDAGTGYPVKI